MEEQLLAGIQKKSYKSSFLTSQIITYLGNKRSLLPFINTAIEYVKKRLNKNRVCALDGFSGSGIVSRVFLEHCDELHTNDLEKYARILNMCYLTNALDIDWNYIHETVAMLNATKHLGSEIGFIEKNYAPKDDENIQLGERVFYTKANAHTLDTIKKLFIQK